jgi:hypothetical protein
MNETRNLEFSIDSTHAYQLRREKIRRVTTDPDRRCEIVDGLPKDKESARSAKTAKTANRRAKKQTLMPGDGFVCNY